MIEFVAFDFDEHVLTYQDGAVIAETPYYYDAMRECYTFQSLLPLLRATAPGAPVYHLSHSSFVQAVERVGRYNRTLVLELARKQGQL